MRNLFYCTKCKKTEIDIRFDSHKDRDKVTWINCRDGFGRHITHIICPYCGYELSGFMNVLGLYEKDNKLDELNLIEYVRQVINGYSDGSFCDSKELLELIRKDRNK